MDKLRINGPMFGRAEQILTSEARYFLTELIGTHRDEHKKLMAKRKEEHHLIRTGAMPLDFRPDTAEIRNTPWQISPLLDEFWEPGIELTGPAGDRKMVINALNSGAVRYMADQEDSESPAWRNIINGQINLYDAVRETINYTNEKGVVYLLKGSPSKLMHRSRGLHLSEPHVFLNSEPIPAAFFDFGLHVFHNAGELLARQKSVHEYLAKLETMEEAAFWDKVFVWAQAALNIPVGTFKETMLSENIRAVLQAHEMLWALRRHSAGKNVGRYDKMASDERMLWNRIFPERRQITMAVPPMDSYVDFEGYVCDFHGAPLYGGMEGQIPVKNNPDFSAKAMEKAKRGKEREAHEKGCVRAWVAHPGMVEPMQKIFTDRPAGWRDTAHQRYQSLPPMTAERLLAVPEGTITEEGVRENVVAYIKYVAGWLRAVGAVAIDYYTLLNELYAYLMEDAATAEQARTQLTKWVRLGAKLDDGRLITRDFVLTVIAEELLKIATKGGEQAYLDGKYDTAALLLTELLDFDESQFPEYLTEHAMPWLLKEEELAEKRA